MISSKSYLISLFSTVILFSSCGKKKDTFEKPAAAPVVVDVIVAGQQEVGGSFEVNGTILANEFVELRSEISGLLTFLDIPEGKTVTKGTVLGRINNADLQAQLAKTKTLLELAETTEGRLKKLLDVNGVNQSDFDIAVNQVKSLKADIAITEALIDKTIIRAPFTGTVGLRKVSPGAYITPADVIATMQMLNSLKVDFTIPEEYQAYIKKGSYVDVINDKVSQIPQRALIVATEPQIDVTTRNILVRALLSSNQAQPGSFAKVHINIGKGNLNVMIPSNSIIPDARKDMVVLVKGGKALFTDIDTGVRKAGLVEVTSGIAPGDSIVVSGVLFAKPGGQVKVRSVKAINELAE